MLSNPPALKRVLNARDIALLTVGATIGSGIFLVPGPVLKAVALSPATALIIWVAGGVLTLLGALTYAELGAGNAPAGGLYAFLRDAFGPLVAFLFGWCMFLVIGSGTVAALAVAFSDYASELIPISASVARAISAVLIVALAFVNLQKTRSSARLQNIFTIAKILGIAALASVLLALGTGGNTAVASHPTVLTVRGLAFAITAVLWAYEGWQYAIYLAGETREPRRVLPLGLAIGAVLLLALYLLANLGYLAALGSEAMGESQRTAARALAAVTAPWAGKLLSILVMVSIVSAANGCIFSSARIYHAMSVDGLFFRAFRYVHPRTHAPAVAVCSIGLWSTVLALTGSFSQLLSYVVSIGWAFYGLSAAALFVLRRRPGYRTAFHVPGYPWTPAMFVAVAGFVVIYTLVLDPLRCAMGVMLLLVGILVYALSKFFSSASSSESVTSKSDGR
jgi:basic amino acid/polyamine antiporter, APA family